MFKIFESNFACDSFTRPRGSGYENVPDIAWLMPFFDKYGGASFESGLYRVIRATDLKVWQKRISLAFPDFSNRVVCFAYDWAGDAFALNLDRLEDGQPGVTLFEPGMREVLQIPSNLQTFHENGLTEFGEAILSISFFENWRQSGGGAPTYDQCVGYRKPLFLSGVDELENLELTDLDVYWRIMGQLIQGTTGLAPGTAVRINLR